MKALFARVGITTLFLCLLVVTVLAIRGGTRSKEGTQRRVPTVAFDQRPSAVIPTAQAPAPVALPAVPVAQVVAQPAFPAVPAGASPVVMPAAGAAVPDDALLQLASLVNLAGATTQPPDKTRWAQAVPVASKLMEAPCDCDQRNWLKHFVAMGNDALTDSSADYLAEAQLIPTLRRYDTQSKQVAGR